MNNTNSIMGRQPNNGVIAIEHREGDIITPPNPSSWQLFPSDPSSSSGGGATVAQGNHNPCQHHSQLLDLNRPVTEDEAMAFQRADPEPFLPEHLEALHVPNRRFMTRAVAPYRPQPRNENLAIVTINPLPGNPMLFGNVRSVLRDFFREIVPMQYLSIQKTSLGQAMVRLTYAHARDTLI
jgi:hypothetical protein